jgi:hypothetical protein
MASQLDTNDDWRTPKTGAKYELSDGENRSRYCVKSVFAQSTEHIFISHSKTAMALLVVAESELAKASSA